MIKNKKKKYKFNVNSLTGINYFYATMQKSCIVNIPIHAIVRAQIDWNKLIIYIKSKKLLKNYVFELS